MTVSYDDEMPSVKSSAVQTQIEIGDSVESCVVCIEVSSLSLPCLVQPIGGGGVCLRPGQHAQGHWHILY